MASDNNVDLGKLFSEYCDRVKLKLIPQLETEAEDLFEKIAYYLSVSEARRIYTEVAKRSPKRRKGAHNPERDRVLLKLYDALSRRGCTVPDLARALDKKEPGWFGPKGSPGAIGKRLRRLLIERRKTEDFVSSPIE